MWFDVNYNRLALSLLPTKMKQTKLFSFLKAVVSPFQTIHYSWKQKRERDFYKIDHTGQVCYLRKALNDALDPQERRIYIGDGNSFNRKYIYTSAENKPVFIGKIFIYQNSEYIGTGADFIVFAPQSIIDTKIYELKSIIDFYKLASKRYQIRPIV